MQQFKLKKEHTQIFTFMKAPQPDTSDLPRRICTLNKIFKEKTKYKRSGMLIAGFILNIQRENERNSNSNIKNSYPLLLFEK